MKKQSNKKSSMGLQQTKKCIVCLKRASVWYGHVLDGKEDIFAGFCSEHYGTNTLLLNRFGCFGGYHEKYGKEKCFF